MNKEQVSGETIYEALRKVYSQEELQTMPEQRWNLLLNAMHRKLEKNPNPTDAELQGIRELLDVVSPIELDVLSKALQA